MQAERQSRRSRTRGATHDRQTFELRVRMITAGVWCSYAICVASLGWLALTWEAQNRPAMAALLLLGVVSAFVVARLPARRIVASRHRELFFLAWSLLDIGLVAILALLDGGAASPANGAFFCLLVFAALSYPLRSVVIVSAVNVLAFLAVGLLGSGSGAQSEIGYLWIYSSCLVVVGALCAWQARIAGDQRAELAWSSRTDGLTGALNRRGFSEALDAALVAARRERRGLALLVLDLDDFKSVNDSAGHHAGDEVLRATVAAAEAALEGAGSIGRLGGDEFGLVLPDGDSEQAARIRDALLAKLPTGVGVSTGLACFPADGTTADELYRSADSALYASKRARRAPTALLESIREGHSLGPSRR